MRKLFFLGMMFIYGCGGGGTDVDKKTDEAQPLVWDSGSWDKDKWQ